MRHAFLGEDDARVDGGGCGDSEAERKGRNGDGLDHASSPLKMVAARMSKLRRFRETTNGGANFHPEFAGEKAQLRVQPASRALRSAAESNAPPAAISSRRSHDFRSLRARLRIAACGPDARPRLRPQNAPVVAFVRMQCPLSRLARSHGNNGRPAPGSSAGCAHPAVLCRSQSGGERTRQVRHARPVAPLRWRRGPSGSRCGPPQTPARARLQVRRPLPSVAVASRPPAVLPPCAADRCEIDHLRTVFRFQESRQTIRHRRPLGNRIKMGAQLRAQSAMRFNLSRKIGMDRNRLLDLRDLPQARARRRRMRQAFRDRSSCRVSQQGLERIAPAHETRGQRADGTADDVGGLAIAIALDHDEDDRPRAGHRAASPSRGRRWKVRRATPRPPSTPTDRPASSAVKVLRAARGCGPHLSRYCA